MAGGRPSIYTEELVDKFMARVAIGESVNKICKSDDMPNSDTIFTWLTKKPEFSERYTKAKELAAEALAEQIFDIADDNAFDYIEGQEGKLRVNNDAINRARLRVDVRKWYLSKIVPKKYGERQQVEHSGNIELKSLSDEELTARLIALQNATPDP